MWSAFDLDINGLGIFEYWSLYTYSLYYIIYVCICSLHTDFHVSQSSIFLTLKIIHVLYKYTIDGFEDDRTKRGISFKLVDFTECLSDVCLWRDTSWTLYLKISSIQNLQKLFRKYISEVYTTHRTTCWSNMRWFSAKYLYLRTYLDYE